MFPELEEMSSTADREIHPLATVKRDCILIRDSNKQTKTIIALSSVSGIKRIRTSHPVLLVIAAALFLIAAAAACSKEGAGVQIPIFVLGGVVCAGYWLSKRVSVTFVSGSEAIETSAGSPSAAQSLIEEVHSAQNNSFD